MSRFRLGRDVDAVSKQSSDLLHLFRRELLAVNENFRLAGAELARSVLKPTGVMAYRRPD
jgi:LacI family transcriptional regulator